MNGHVQGIATEEYFSQSYTHARERFCSAARRVGADLLSYPIDDCRELSIDVAVIGGGGGGANNMVVVSSGLHGVEGPPGSAVQLAWLNQIADTGLPPGVGMVLIHAINPFGFANHRRWNEDNIDLNRNFLDNDEDYVGAPRGYVQIESLLNPGSVPSRWEPFPVKAAWNILRFGFQSVKEAIASGQYDYPEGIFFGGKSATASTKILRDNFDAWVGEAEQVLHLDWHTGLGRFAQYRMLLEVDDDSDQSAWFKAVFGREVVEMTASGGTAYQARGTLNGWGARHFADRVYRCATVEYGTYGPIRVLAALRAENRAFQFAGDLAPFGWVQEELRECFCPSSEMWRRQVISSSMEILTKSIRAIAGSDHSR